MAEVTEKVVALTEAAVKKVRQLLTKEPEGSALRISVRGGGCSGLSYDLSFDAKRSTHDEQLDFDGVAVLVDPKSALSLHGMTLEFVDSLTGGGFKFQNPNAKTSCGCGESFST